MAAPRVLVGAVGVATQRLEKGGTAQPAGFVEQPGGIDQRVGLARLDPQEAGNFERQVVLFADERPHSRLTYRGIVEQHDHHVGLVDGRQLTFGDHSEGDLAAFHVQVTVCQPGLDPPLECCFLGRREPACQPNLHGEALYASGLVGKAAHGCASVVVDAGAAAGLGAGAGAALAGTGAGPALVVAKRVASSRSMAEPSCRVRFGT